MKTLIYKKELFLFIASFLFLQLPLAAQEEAVFMEEINDTIFIGKQTVEAKSLTIRKKELVAEYVPAVYKTSQRKICIKEGYEGMYPPSYKKTTKKIVTKEAPEIEYVLKEAVYDTISKALLVKRRSYAYVKRKKSLKKKRKQKCTNEMGIDTCKMELIAIPESRLTYPTYVRKKAHEIETIPGESEYKELTVEVIDEAKTQMGKKGDRAIVVEPVFETIEVAVLMSPPSIHSYESKEIKNVNFIERGDALLINKMGRDFYCGCSVSGHFYSKDTDKPISNALAKLTNLETRETEEMETDGEGRYIFGLAPETNYTVHCSKEAFFTETRTVSTVGRDCTDKAKKEMLMSVGLSLIPSKEKFRNRPIVISTIPSSTSVEKTPSEATPISVIEPVPAPVPASSGGGELPFSNVLPPVTVESYKIPLLSKDATSTGSTVTRAEIKTVPKRTSSSSAVSYAAPPPPMYAPKPMEMDIPMDKASTKPRGQKIHAGTLTAGEVNDFSKWDLWDDVAGGDLKKWQKKWDIFPRNRYTLQLMNEQGQPLVDAPVRLINTTGQVAWSGKTDNTGRAELWTDLFGGTLNKVVENYRLEINDEEQLYEIETASKFKEQLNVIKLDTPCNASKDLDLLFVVDATGSMKDEIHYLQAELQDVIEQVKSKQTDLNIRLGSVFYRDFHEDYLTEKTPFSTNIQQTVNFIKKMNAKGGGDTPEAVDIALDVAIHDMKWSEKAISRLLFLVLDAPPHNDPKSLKRMQFLTRKAAAMGIRIIPIAASGIQKDTEYLMRAMALATNGTYVFLTDHSGVGNGHIEPSTDSYDVEFLNDVLIRLIEQYTSIPDCDDQDWAKGLIDEVLVENKAKKKAEKQTGFKMYPNPTSGIVNIELKADATELYVFDVSGKIVLRKEKLSAGNTELNLSQLANGVYAVKYHQGGDWWEGGKVVLIR